MDKKTLKSYKENANQIFKKYDSSSGGIEKYFKVSFPPNASILDVGAGSGRDMLYLLHEGYDAYGIEPCEELRNLAINNYPELNGRLNEGQLPELNTNDEKYDGILCSAVIMHIPKVFLFDSVFALRSKLKPNGRLLLSIPASRPGINNLRDCEGRLFHDYKPEYLQLLFERLGFQKIGRWDNEDSLGRTNYSWTTLLLELKNSSLIRPIDQIESILNRDRKVATYKPALFRALCDIAITNFNQADWESSGYVSLPLDSIVEKWIYYYWPIVESTNFLPQIYGESPEGKLKISFRQSLKKLIDYYKNLGGLYRFTLEFRNSTYSADVKPLINEVYRSIRKAIVTGPVQYAGGSLETGSVFEYDKIRKTVKLETHLWHEICLMGHWINDAIVLRWAELTSNISGKSIRPSEVVDLLLTTPIPERDVFNVRQIYLEANVKECVWSGNRLRGKFDVDHVIPFSLWRNNDLWNLLPAESKVNRNKRDKLPTRQLLNCRKECIIDYWRL